MMHRCEQIGIKCAVWDGRSQPDGASIVFVTPEKATSEEFGTFVNRIRQTKRLDRIVIDECHVVLNDQLDFRKHLQKLGKLASAETQMVLLTATLPPTELPSQPQTPPTQEKGARKRVPGARCRHAIRIGW